MILMRQHIKNLMIAASRWDGWQNLFTGFGTSRDKRTLTTFEPNLQLSDQQLENLYLGDDMAARIVDTVPEECLRKGFNVKIEDEDNPDKVSEVEEDVQSALNELDVNDKYIEAHVWSRLYGGAAILIGADDGASIEQMSEPLAEDRIRKITHLTVIEKRYLIPRKWYDDPMAPKFGYPETYEIINAIGSRDSSFSFTGMEIHESRLILFDGVRVSVTRRQQNNGWGDSVLQRVNEVLQDFGVGWQAVGHLLADGSQGVYKMKGLIDAVTSESTTVIQQRMTVMELGRSICRALILDADSESFERQAYSFGGLDKILQMFVLRLSAAARIPATVLMGQSPAGENATGEADFQWFFNTIDTTRKFFVTPKLERIVGLVLKSKEGPTRGQVPDDWHIVFPPLWNLNPQQEADMRLKVAQMDQIYGNMGVTLPEEITLSRFKPDGWSMETTVDLDLRREVLEIEKDRELENAKNPPQPPPQLPVPPTGGQPPTGQEPDEKQEL